MDGVAQTCNPATFVPFAVIAKRDVFHIFCLYCTHMYRFDQLHATLAGGMF
jgi:hypothetical protein